ncbi:MAG: hypothetical protein PWQ77_1070 [Kosmotogales bacterium]|nr:hypothetical protein [Kosmotogales bacterium]
MQKRLLIFLFLLLISVAFSGYFDTVIDYFNDYVSEYQNESSDSPLIQKLKEDMQNLGLYRLYKLQMVGSIDKKESATSIADLLTEHMELLDENTFENYQSKIAYGAFLGWVITQFSDQTFQLGTLNTMPAYNESYNSFLYASRDWASIVYQNWISYALGLSEEEPYLFPKDIKKSDSLSGYNLKELEIDDDNVEIIKELTNKAVIEQINIAVNSISSKKYDVSKIFKDAVTEKVSIMAKDIPEDLREKAEELFTLWLYRSFSLIENAPYYPQDLPVTEKAIPGFTTEIINSESEYEAVENFLNTNEDLKTKILTNAKVQKMMLNNVDVNPAKLIQSDIQSESKKVVAPFTINMGNIKNELSAKLIKAQPKSLNLSWLRFVLYIALILIAFFLVKSLKKFIFPLIVLLEFVYLLFMANIITNIIDISFYAITIVPLSIFTLLLVVSKLLSNKNKRTLTDLLKLALLVLVFVLPFIKLYPEVPELKMDNFSDFYSSPYYGELKSDLYESDSSLINIAQRNLYSIISSELSDLKREYNTVIKNNLNDFIENTETEVSIKNDKISLKIPIFSDYMSIENQSVYGEKIEQLQRLIAKFERESKASYSSFLSASGNYSDLSEEIVKYSGEPLRVEFSKYVAEGLTAKEEYKPAYEIVSNRIVDELNLEPKAANIVVSREKNFILLALATILFAVTVVLFKKPYLVLGESILMIIALIVFWINSGILNIYVQTNAPILKIATQSGLNPIFIIIYFVIIVLGILISFNLLKGREQK